MAAQEAPAWRFVRFGLLVTGKGEERFLPRLFRALTENGQCTFQVIARISQLSPIVSTKKKLKMVGVGKQIPTKDEEIGIAARMFLQKHADSYVVVIDDLEGSRVQFAKDVFERYRRLLDTMLKPFGLQDRASVHFLANMMEAYYFADARAINEVMGTTWADYDGDVEELAHPKNDLKTKLAGFDEIDHGKKIVDRLDLRHVLSRPDTCAFLRTIIGWCVRAMGIPVGVEFRLVDGNYSEITKCQTPAART
ncbi:MAG: DUF4276 family protein [Gemmataceae bacterium]|nr:DUF4276 family protein [Gemmataceae bacterium]